MRPPGQLAGQLSMRLIQECTSERRRPHYSVHCAVVHQCSNGHQHVEQLVVADMGGPGIWPAESVHQRLQAGQGRKGTSHCSV